ncbi:MAG: putative quinol monooxygenase [Brevibacterium sp.]
MTDTIVIIAESQAAAGQAERVRKLFTDLIDRTRAEDGCLRYELFRDRDDDHRFILMEEWRDQAALDAHLSSEHIAAFFREVMALLAEEGRMTYASRIA